MEYQAVRMDWRNRRDRFVVVPGELLSIYQPVIGAEAVLAWINLAYALLEVGVIIDPAAELEKRQGLGRAAAEQALARLQEARLLEPSPEGGLVLREPAPRGRLVEQGLFQAPAEDGPGAPPLAPRAELAAAAGLEPPPFAAPAVPGGATAGEFPAPAPAGQPPSGGAAPEEGAAGALQAVADFYQKRIGLLGPVQFEKLRFWVEEKGVSPDVVAAAIEETALSADHPRIQYLEGVLRNWYNDGVRSIQDLIERKHWPKALGGKPAPKGDAGGSSGGPKGQRARGAAGGGTGSPETKDVSIEGLPNASAYRKVDPEEIRRWKALHPEDYTR